MAGMNGMNGVKKTKLSLKDLEAEVIGAAYEVSNILGAGFLEMSMHLEGTGARLDRPIFPHSGWKVPEGPNQV